MDSNFDSSSGEGEPQSVTGREARERLHSLSIQRLTRNEAFERVLDIGMTYLGVDGGFITDIDAEKGRWEVIASTETFDEEFPAGTSSDLGDTYCRQTIRQETPLALHNAPEQGWEDDDAYILHGLDTYIGVRLDVFGRPFGTLCFIAEEPRPEPFSDAEVIFVELAGRIVEQVLERTHHQQEIANRDRVIAVLNRVLRHNLRNDMNIIQGNAETLRKHTSEEHHGHAETIISRSKELLDLAEKARQLEDLTTSATVARPTDLVDLTANTVANLQRNHPEADISMDAPAEVLAMTAPQLEMAIQELVENAVKHGGDSPHVVVEVDVDSGRDHARVSIHDDGPGLPDEERHVLTDGTETRLEHGSGLGLFLVHWIVETLDVELRVDASPEGTTISLIVPR